MDVVERGGRTVKVDVTNAADARAMEEERHEEGAA